MSKPKRRRATPRLLAVMEWAVERREAFRHRSRRELDGDVVLLSLRGEWEHGQRQTVRAAVPSADVEPLACELLAAVGVERSAALPPRGAAAADPVAVGSLPTDTAPGPLASSVSEPNRGLVMEVLEQRLDRTFGDRPARARFVDPWLRRNEVGSLEELPIAELAAMTNRLREPST